MSSQKSVIFKNFELSYFLKKIFSSNRLFWEFRILKLSKITRLLFFESSNVSRIENFRANDCVENPEISSDWMVREFRTIEQTTVSRNRCFREIINFKKSTVLTRKLWEIIFFEQSKFSDSRADSKILFQIIIMQFGFFDLPMHFPFDFWNPSWQMHS